MNETELPVGEMRKHLPSNLVAVVADDMPAERRVTAQAFTDVNEGYLAVEAKSWEKLLELAMVGRDGRPVAVVCLDHHYGNKREWQWGNTTDFLVVMQAVAHKARTTTPGAMEAVTNRWGDFESVRTQNPTANSVLLARLLRLLGYAGTIVVVSSLPPNPYEYVMVDENGEKTMLVQGVVYKCNDPEYCQFGLAPSDTFARWDETMMLSPTESGMTDGLVAVLHRVLVEDGHAGD